MIKIIDIHTHTFPAKIAGSAINKLSATSHTRPFSDGTINGLINSMNEAEISLSVIQPVATKAEQVRHINDGAIKINSQHENLISFGAIHPDFEDYAYELARISEAGVKGIKLHPVYQGVKIDDKNYVKILARAAELGLIVMLHAGFDIGFPGNDYASPSRILRALKSAGDVKIILAHMGGWRCWDEAEDLFAGMNNVYIDTAFSLGEFFPNGDNYYSSREECLMLSDEKFVKLIKSFGAEKVLFGSDSPWASQSDSVKKILALLSLSEREKNLILCYNLHELLSL